MLIKGTVTAVGMPHGSDKWGNSYQWITVNTPAGPITGQKASKQQLTQNFVGQQVEWDCENGTGLDGQPCKKFKRPKQQYPAQQPQQGYQQPAQRPNAVSQHQQDVPGKVRHGVVCAYIMSGKEPEIDLVNYWVNFILTGNAPPPPGAGYDDEDPAI